ncbi:MAG: hypothetical protein R3A10_11940 [Caldilineaceae bacterium]
MLVGRHAGDRSAECQPAHVGGQSEQQDAAVRVYDDSTAAQDERAALAAATLSSMTRPLPTPCRPCCTKRGRQSRNGRRLCCSSSETRLRSNDVTGVMV